MILATQIVHWPGKDTFACDKHAVQLRKVAAAMGFVVSSTISISYTIPCENCPNEEGLEPVSIIAERMFPDEVKEVRRTEEDRMRGKSIPLSGSDRTREELWIDECQESWRLNR
jgi:hypothetical protein